MLSVLVVAAALAATTGCAVATSVLHGAPPADARRFTETVVLQRACVPAD